MKSRAICSRSKKRVIGWIVSIVITIVIIITIVIVVKNYYPTVATAKSTVETNVSTVETKSEPVMLVCEQKVITVPAGTPVYRNYDSEEILFFTTVKEKILLEEENDDILILNEYGCLEAVRYKQNSEDGAVSCTVKKNFECEIIRLYSDGTYTISAK